MIDIADAEDIFRGYCGRQAPSRPKPAQDLDHF
jgi:hypothetical protein